MSADWFCKIGERKIGPLNGRQLKTVVAKGQLKPEHLVRRGSEGPWVPAGRIKGLFSDSPAGDEPPANDKKLPPATAKPLGKTTARPGGPPKAKATNLPTAAEAPAPPASDMPHDLMLGGNEKRHGQLNVDGLDYETTPVSVSRRKVKSGMKGLRKEEQKKLTVMLMCLIGGGMTIGLGVFIWAIATGKFSAPVKEAKDPMAVTDQPADSGQKPKKTAEKKLAAAATDTKKFRQPNIEDTLVGNVIVRVLRPTRGAPPKGAKTVEGEVLIVPVNLSLKEGTAKAVDLTSWADAVLKTKVSLTDDQKNRYELLDQMAGAGGESKAIPPEKRIQVQLIFQAPANAKPSALWLELPPAAFHGDGPMICYKIDASEIKQAQSGK